MHESALTGSQGGLGGCNPRSRIKTASHASDRFFRASRDTAAPGTTHPYIYSYYRNPRPLPVALTTPQPAQFSLGEMKVSALEGDAPFGANFYRNSFRFCLTALSLLGYTRRNYAGYR
jgi:hypothetical protein